MCERFKDFEGVEIPARCRWGVILLVGMMLMGCSSTSPPGGPRVKTYPVTGVVNVDGVPTQGVRILFVPQGDSGVKFSPVAGTLEGGKISAMTYKFGDGVPAGTYKLTFEKEVEEKTELGIVLTKDALKGAYANVETSKHEVTIAKDKKNDLGVIELSTQ